MLKGVLFDFDGTLVDSERIHFEVWNQVLQPYGVTLGLEEYKRVYVGKPTPRNAMDVILSYRLDEDPVRLGELKQAAFHAWVQSAELPLMVYAREAVAFFRGQGLRLAVVTGSARRGVLFGLEQNGLLASMDAVVTRDDVVHSKPHPESYQRAVSVLQLDATECIAFEDTESGVQSAKAAGIVCYAVRNEFTRDHDLSLADAVFEDLREATAWVAAEYGLPSRT